MEATKSDKISTIYECDKEVVSWKHKEHWELNNKNKSTSIPKWTKDLNKYFTIKDRNGF